MIYIWFICLFLITCFANPKDIKPETIDFLWNGLCICLLILPIWWGIRECVKELKKIREALEKAGVK